MYCAYVTRIKNLRKHTNADRLMCGECFGNTVIVDLGTDPNQLGVYFPVDGKLGVEFAQKNDLLRRKDENGDPAGGDVTEEYTSEHLMFWDDMESYDASLYQRLLRDCVRKEECPYE